MPYGASTTFVRFVELSAPSLAFGAVAICSALALVALRQHPRSSLRASLFVNLAATAFVGLELVVIARIALARKWRRDEWVHLGAILMFILSSLQPFSKNLLGGFLDPLRDLQVSRVALGGAAFAAISSLGVIGAFAAEARKVAEARADADGELAVRRRAEAELESSKRQLADILDFLPDPTFAIDLEGRIISWNRAIAELSGLRTKDAIGKGDYEYGVPFFGSRRPILIDLALKPDPEMEAKYDTLVRQGDAIVAENYNTYMRSRAGRGASAGHREAVPRRRGQHRRRHRVGCAGTVLEHRLRGRA